MAEKKEKHTTYTIGPVSRMRLREELARVWQSGGAGREALSKELATRRSWTFPRREGIPWDNEHGIMYLKAYNDKLYAWNNDMGRVWEFDGRNWKMIHEEPLPLPKFRGVSYGAEIFNGKLNIGHFQFDGETWRTVSGLPEKSSINALKEYNGRLYAVVYTWPYTRNLYVSDDGLNFEVFWTAPSATADFLRSLEVYWNELYIGGYKPGAAPIYKTDGATVTLDYTTSVDEVYLDVIGGRLFAFSGKNIYAYADPRTRYLPTTWTDLGYTLFGAFFKTVDWRGAVIFPNVNTSLIYALYSNIYSQLVAIPFHRSGYRAPSAEVYNGRLYLCHEGPIALEPRAASVWEFDELPTRPVPAHYRLWTDETVPVAGSRTLAPPTVGGRKTFYLLSDQDGTVEIEVDIDGGGLGAYQTFDTDTVTANKLWRYTTLDEFCWARLHFTPSAEATVQAWLSVVPE